MFPTPSEGLSLPHLGPGMDVCLGRLWCARLRLFAVVEGCTEGRVSESGHETEAVVQIQFLNCMPHAALANTAKPVNMALTTVKRGVSPQRHDHAQLSLA